MPKLNTFLAAALSASMLIMPVEAGQPGYSSGYSVHPGYNAQYSSSTGYASSSYSQATTTAGSSQLYGGDIVCQMQGTPVPCDGIPGLYEALYAQGLGSIADQLPPYSGQPVANLPSYVNSAANYQYAGNSHATAVASSSSSYASSSAYAGATSYHGATSPSGVIYSQSVQPTYASTASRSYTSGSAAYGSEVWVTPCGQVVTRPAPVPTCATQTVRYVEAAPAPVTVQLANGTVYGLNGGVGAGIYGEFYGGGGTIIEGGARYSGVLSASASSFTFNRQRTTPTPHTRNPRPKTRYPRPHTRNPRNHGGGGCGGGC